MYYQGKYIGYIYQITNLINHKIYIGQTSETVERRFKNHISASKNINNKKMNITNAIRKYGETNFSVKIICCIMTTTEALLHLQLNQKEMYYIKKYNSIRPNGYNITPGGNNVSDISKSPVDQYTISGEYIATFSSHKEALQKVVGTNNKTSNIGMVCQGKSKTAFGYVWRYHNEPFDKYESNHIDTRVKIDQYDLNGNYIHTYKSSSDAAKSLNKYIKDKNKGSSGHIIACCQGKRPYAYNYVWRYHGDNYDLYSVKPNQKHVCVNQYTLDGVYLATYYSIKEAALSTSTSYTGIVNCCKNKRKTSGGYQWAYTDIKTNCKAGD